jgi:hypothetical protein
MLMSHLIHTSPNNFIFIFEVRNFGGFPKLKFFLEDDVPLPFDSPLYVKRGQLWARGAMLLGPC